MFQPLAFTLFHSGGSGARVSEMWDEQVRAEGVDNHKKDQISFWDALGKAAHSAKRRDSQPGARLA